MSKIIIPTHDGYQIVKLDDILYISSMDIYAFIHTLHDKMLIATSLTSLEECLVNQTFFRSHKSYLVNIKHITKIKKGSNCKLELTNGDCISLSRLKKKPFWEYVESRSDFISYHKPK